MTIMGHSMKQAAGVVMIAGVLILGYHVITVMMEKKS